MHTMKAEHIELVERMQNAYREIEEGSKVNSTESVALECVCLSSTTLLAGPVQGVCATAEKATWNEGDCVQAGGQTAAG